MSEFATQLVEGGVSLPVTIEWLAAQLSREEDLRRAAEWFDGLTTAEVAALDAVRRRDIFAHARGRINGYDGRAVRSWWMALVDAHEGNAVWALESIITLARECDSRAAR